MKRSITMFLGLVTLLSCTSNELSQKGATVVVVKSEPPLCEYLGTVNSDPGVDVDTANNQMRNQAAKRGANTIVLDAITRKDDDIIHNGRAYKCP